MEVQKLARPKGKPPFLQLERMSTSRSAALRVRLGDQSSTAINQIATLGLQPLLAQICGNFIVA